MTETHPPRIAEAILESFGAEPGFRDAIIGDLAQEHAQRVERYGDRAARLWYYRQAALASPALLRNWLAGARWADARRLTSVVGLAYVMTVMIEIGALFLIATVAGHWVPLIGDGLLGRSGFNAAIFSPTKAQLVGALVAGTFAPTCAGYLAASFEEQRPMIGAAAFAAASALAIIAGILITSILPVPDLHIDFKLFTLLRLAAIPLIAALCMTGGAIRVRVVSARQAAVASFRPS